MILTIMSEYEGAKTFNKVCELTSYRSLRDPDKLKYDLFLDSLITATRY